ncbi:MULTISPECIES: hypothetical protein [Enterobacterales]|uniref:hypothetical protein n=1 Tax=Enterobacterales TaxID=91347 RepID=UPI002ED8DCC7
MERIVEVTQTKISEIRGYMANSSVDCASGTCDCGGFISAEEVLTQELEEISAEFFF